MAETIKALAAIAGVVIVFLLILAFPEIAKTIALLIVVAICMVGIVYGITKLARG